ncbi:MAG: hypothetical protein Q8P59_00870 [Dehalococcoidia bacterium]|nr:hypothetical protein [Dehalococcoidia bacterium]
MKVYAARISTLGLTAYGDTQEEAQTRLVKLLQSYIHALFEVGTVDDWLVRSGLVTIEVLERQEGEAKEV